MKLNKAEIAAVIITVLFIGFTAAVSLTQRGGSSAVTITAERSEASENPDSMASPSPESSFQAPLNINTATEQELCSLPGIGEKLAERIVAYREENGPFSDIDEIMGVDGIGAKTYEELKDYITTD